MQAKSRVNSSPPKLEEPSTGTKMVAKYRSRMSAVSDEERQRLMARGLQIIYGDRKPAKRAHRS